MKLEAVLAESLGESYFRAVEFLFSVAEHSMELWTVVAGFLDSTISLT